MGWEMEIGEVASLCSQGEWGFENFSKLIYFLQILNPLGIC
jgi:hypothetical protein